MHPEVQLKAQQQISTVVGPERLVRFEDLAALPYLQAIVKEVGRWHTVASISMIESSGLTRPVS